MIYWRRTECRRRTYVKVEPEYEYDMESDVNDAEGDEDVPLKGHEEVDAMVDKHSDHCMPHTHHAQDDQRQ
jgi:hypothetical protein